MLKTTSNGIKSMWEYVKMKFLAHPLQHRISERQDLLQSLLARPPFVSLAVIGFLTLFGKIIPYIVHTYLLDNI